MHIIASVLLCSVLDIVKYVLNIFITSFRVIMNHLFYVFICFVLQVEFAFVNLRL